MGSSVFEGRYYRMNRLFMRHVGIWPEQSRTARVMLPSLIISIIGSILVPEIFILLRNGCNCLSVFENLCELDTRRKDYLKLLFFTAWLIFFKTAFKLVRMRDVWGETDSVIEGLPIMITIVVSWVKLLNGVIKRPAIRELVQRMENDWKSFSNSPSAMVILEKYAEQQRVITVFYSGFIYVMTTAFNGLPLIPLVMNVLVPLNESRKKKYLYEAEYGVDSEKYYYYILFHSYIASYLCIMLYVVIDTTMSTWVQHCCALFEIVSYNLKFAVGEMNSESSEVKSKTDIEYRNLCLCVRQHKEAITFANLIESTYSTSLAMIVAGNMVHMSISGVLMLIKVGDTEDVIRFAVLTFVPVFHLYFNTVPGQKLSDYSQKISDSIYENDWYSFPPHAQKLLVLIIARAQKPNLITAGKFYVLNVQSFSAVMQTSISYFTVLSSVRH